MLFIFVLFDFRATCIEMVTSLAYTHHGRQYLAQEGVIDQISNIIVGADSDPFSGFYLPGESSSSNV
jgi:26S proteasome non-ATPase regulatory subunit 5